MKAPDRPVVGLALGSGSARGWAHIGVIRALEQAGIRLDVVCGTSIGAMVGAVHAVGELDRFERWVRGLSVKDVVSFMDFRLTGGMLKGERLMEFFRRNFVDHPIEKLPLPFGAVATALDTGAEVWLRTGSTVEAVRASMALPALFSPVFLDGRLLADGGLVNPVPVSLARAMGADIVIAVDLNSDILGRRLRRAAEPEGTSDERGEWVRRLQGNLSALLPAAAPDTPKRPSLLDVVFSSINIMQMRITRSRMAGDPPDVVVAPRLSRLGLLDFHRASEAIDEGNRAVQACLHHLRALDITAP